MIEMIGLIGLIGLIVLIEMIVMIVLIELIVMIVMIVLPFVLSSVFLLCRGERMELDKNAVTKTVSLVALRVLPSNVQSVLSFLPKSALFRKQGVRNVLEDKSDPNFRLILLNPDVVSTLDLVQLPDHIRVLLLEGTGKLTPDQLRLLTGSQRKASPKKTTTKEKLVTPIHFRQTLTFDNLSIEEILSMLLPPSVPPVSSFETIGHILHLNLRSEHDPFKKLIGQVLLSVCPLIS